MYEGKYEVVFLLLMILYKICNTVMKYNVHTLSKIRERFGRNQVQFHTRGLTSSKKETFPLL
jgi:hypothetical protein